MFADPDRQMLAALADLGAQRMRTRVEEALANIANANAPVATPGQ